MQNGFMQGGKKFVTEPRKDGVREQISQSDAAGTYKTPPDLQEVLIVIQDYQRPRIASIS